MKASRWIANLPNLITLARLLMAPLAIAMLISQRFVAAFAIFVLAAVSDGIDGFIAKRFGLASELGALLDPLADKALLVSIFIATAALGLTPPWLAILVVSRDLMIVAAVAVSWGLRKPVAIRPVFVSKFNTTAQIAFAALTLASRAFGLHAEIAETFLVWLVAGSTLASGAVYIGQWLDHMSR